MFRIWLGNSLLLLFWFSFGDFDSLLILIFVTLSADILQRKVKFRLRHRLKNVMRNQKLSHVQLISPSSSSIPKRILFIPTELYTTRKQHPLFLLLFCNNNPKGAAVYPKVLKNVSQRSVEKFNWNRHTGNLNLAAVYPTSPRSISTNRGKQSPKIMQSRVICMRYSFQ